MKFSKQIVLGKFFFSLKIRRSKKTSNETTTLEMRGINKARWTTHQPEARNIFRRNPREFSLNIIYQTRNSRQTPLTNFTIQKTKQFEEHKAQQKQTDDIAMGKYTIIGRRENYLCHVVRAVMLGECEKRAPGEKGESCIPFIIIIGYDFGFRVVKRA